MRRDTPGVNAGDHVRHHCGGDYRNSGQAYSRVPIRIVAAVDLGEIPECGQQPDHDVSESQQLPVEEEALVHQPLIVTRGNHVA